MVYKIGIAFLATLLGGCGPGKIELDVSGTRDDLRFSVVRPGGAAVCVKSLYVFPAMPDNAPSSWTLLLADNQRCADRFRYAVEESGFAAAAPPAVLKPGIPYRVRATGGGFDAVRDFIVKPDGTVVQERLMEDQ
ncbi:hypothetical protein QLH51_15340 [Sphingomonas sp. 2R-10]|uniref:hypothetical protein n=1 Tax=Sphingomonas sp. 2R-10 TaxID=3045148 RepID=UPI000F78BD61|nr:hypothetical protein [Sphingomonas sp. 2R-10]MDJ0278172.1 hypothetical protein [Sphingomonas sp. 2R-10]